MNDLLLYEMVALINLIHERKTGWAVDVAKERINYLQLKHGFSQTTEINDYDV